TGAGEGDKNKKTDKKKELSELNELFKPVVAAQKVSKGVDPKSVVCAFFKQGQCTKGDKCKFSHDLSLERKCEKRSVYFDGRDEDLEKGPFCIWVCRYFLDAIENNKYGWFWVCPGGGDVCMYRHALPSGFVLKKDKKKEEKEEEIISMEELIEKERSALGPTVTRVTLETFLSWKKRKREDKISKAEVEMEKRRADFTAGRSFGVSGREVFQFRPELVDDDDEEADDSKYVQNKDDNDEDEIEDSVQVNEIDLARFVPKEVEYAGITVAGTDRFTATDANKISGASGGAEANGEHSEGETQENEEIEAVPVDENLFTGEDLDELEEELNTLDLEE
ncbi:Zinc finger CCCH domain-containing protein 15, partial [Acipenser ruthenus]